MFEPVDLDVEKSAIAAPVYENPEESKDPINFSVESTVPSTRSDEYREANDEDDDDDSLENIIPLEKIKNGWNVLSSFAIAAATVVKDKSIEAYNSEAAKNLRQTASENWEKTGAPYWEKTTTAAAPYLEKTATVAAPIWEKTKNTVTVAVEITKEQTIAAVEAAKPTVEKVAHTAVEVGSYSWEQVKKAAEIAQQEIAKISKDLSEDKSQYTPSALDGAVKGQPMTV